MDLHVLRVVSLAFVGFFLFIAAMPLLWVAIYKWTLFVLNVAGIQ